jgi:hypothetical protein
MGLRVQGKWCCAWLKKGCMELRVPFCFLGRKAFWFGLGNNLLVWLGMWKSCMSSSLSEFCAVLCQELGWLWRLEVLKSCL